LCSLWNSRASKIWVFGLAIHSDLQIVTVLTHDWFHIEPLMHYERACVVLATLPLLTVFKRCRVFEKNDDRMFE